MEIAELAENVKDKKDFIVFLNQLQKDLLNNQQLWENPELTRYLNAMEAFLTDSTEKSLNKIDFTPSWSLFARIMVAASVYE
jgi:hypothetical protein